MALAKNKDMAAWLSYLLRERGGDNGTDPSIYKAYYALICGKPQFKEGLLR